MQVNTINPNFGSAITVNNIYHDGQLIYSRYKRYVNTKENDKLVNAIMKALSDNLKLPVDTPIAMKMQEIVPDLYHKFEKIVRPYRLPDTLREVNLLTGKEVCSIDGINNSNLERKKKGYLLEQAIREMFDRSNGIFKGFINIYSSTYDMVEKEGKKLHELIAIDNIEQTLM